MQVLFVEPHNPPHQFVTCTIYKDISDIRTTWKPFELVHTLFCSSKYLSLQIMLLLMQLFYVGTCDCSHVCSMLRIFDQPEGVHHSAVDIFHLLPPNVGPICDYQPAVAPFGVSYRRPWTSGTLVVVSVAFSASRCTRDHMHWGQRVAIRLARMCCAIEDLPVVGGQQSLVAVFVSPEC